MSKQQSLTIISVLLGIFAGVVCSSAFALENTASTYCKPGFYTGIEAGFDNTNYDATDLLSEARSVGFGPIVSTPYPPRIIDRNIDDKGIGGRLYAGYQFNPYFALETGYTQFHKTAFTGSTVNPPGGRILCGSICVISEQYHGEVTEHAADLSAKLTYPLGEGFGVFAKGGAAYVSSERHINTTFTLINGGGSVSGNTFYTKSYQAVRPVYGVGVDYTLPYYLCDVDAAYTEIASGGGIPKTNLISLGISKKFA